LILDFLLSSHLTKDDPLLKHVAGFDPRRSLLSDRHIAESFYTAAPTFTSSVTGATTPYHRPNDSSRSAKSTLQQRSNLKRPSARIGDARAANDGHLGGETSPPPALTMAD
jgi:hypothetical protein